jgi:hypothetical protein
MSLCELLNHSYQRIQSYTVDINSLDNNTVQECEATLTQCIQELSILQEVLSLPNEVLERINNKYTTIDIDTVNVSSLIASSPEEITEYTVIYEGDLDLSNRTEPIEPGELPPIVRGSLDLNNYNHPLTPGCLPSSVVREVYLSALNNTVEQAIIDARPDLTIN